MRSGFRRSAFPKETANVVDSATNQELVLDYHYPLLLIIPMSDNLGAKLRFPSYGVSILVAWGR
jgi:hypothetical protein